MGTLLRDYLPHVLALLGGGVVGSLGLTWWARSRFGRPRLVKLGGFAFGAVATVVGGGAALLAFLLGQRTLEELGPGLTGLQPSTLLLFGVLIGIPLSLPGLIFSWNEARAADRVARKKRDWVPTKDDRRAFANDLVRQIREVSPKPREVSAAIDGDGGRVLRLEGDIDAKEGEKLTGALRADLSELGFKRVEGGSGSGAWWSRV